MKPLQLIFNGKSAARSEIRAAVGRMREQGCSIGLSVTCESGDASRGVATARSTRFWEDFCGSAAA